MSTRLFICLLLFVFCVNNALAQNTNDSFQQFRQEVIGRYQGFRKSVLDDYAKYLDGVWKEYESFRGVKRDSKPKPDDIPKADDTPVVPVNLPEPEITPVPNEPNVPEKQTKPSVPAIPSAPVVPATPSLPTSKSIEFDFYGMKWTGPMMKKAEVEAYSSDACVKAWNWYKSNGVQKIVSKLSEMARVNGLNDWFTFQMVRKYSNAVTNDYGHMESILLQHFILVNMGYDIRLSRTDSKYFLLVPFEQMVYERGYIVINDKKYHIFLNDDAELQTGEYIYTCDIPQNIDCGRMLSLLYNDDARIAEGNMRGKTLTDGNISITGEVPVTLMEMLRHYPQTDIPVYAMSNIMHALRKDVISQIKPQIAGLSQRDAANKLIRFVQYAFDYATDGEQHGYEKAYFFEENFYYPKNDCEDRSIFYAYLIHELLELDVHLVHFPGHECTAINFTDTSINGDAYVYNGKKYTICDPTYIGANIGVCMPQYRNQTPKVEIWH